jgi:hypothetical protein
MVLPVDDCHIDRCATQRLRCFQAAKSCSDNDPAGSFDDVGHIVVLLFAW